MALPAFARRTPPLQQSIDISCPPGPRLQTCSSGFAAVGQRWDRQTERRTDTGPLPRPCSAYYAGRANKKTNLPNGKDYVKYCSEPEHSWLETLTINFAALLLTETLGSSTFNMLTFITCL